MYVNYTLMHYIHLRKLQKQLPSVRVPTLKVVLYMHHTNLSRTEFVAQFQTNSDLQGRCRALNQWGHTGMNVIHMMSIIFLHYPSSESSAL